MSESERLTKFNSEEILKQYQKTINEIDDYLEYQWTMDTKLTIRNTILNKLDALTENLKQLKGFS